MDPNSAQTPEFTPPPPVRPMSPFYKWMVGIFVVLILIFAAGAGFLLFSRSSVPENPEQTASAEPTVLPTPTTAIRQGPYVDEILGFTIQVPDTASVALSETGVSATIVHMDDLEKDPADYDYYLRISYYDEIGQDPMRAFNAIDCPTPCRENTDPVTLNNARGISAIGPEFSEDKFPVYYIVNNRTLNSPVLSIRIGKNAGRADNPEKIEILKSIVESFEFVAPAPTEESEEVPVDEALEEASDEAEITE